MSKSQSKPDAPLIQAAFEGKLDVLKRLLDKGAAVNELGCNNETALMKAVKMGRNDIVGVLLEVGADVNLESEFGKVTALQMAAYHGRKDIVGMLLTHGADVHSKNAPGYTALDAAESYGNQDVVNLLLDRGATIDHRDEKPAFYTFLSDTQDEIPEEEREAGVKPTVSSQGNSEGYLSYVCSILSLRPLFPPRSFSEQQNTGLFSNFKFLRKQDFKIIFPAEEEGRDAVTSFSGDLSGDSYGDSNNTESDRPQSAISSEVLGDLVQQGCI